MRLTGAWFWLGAALVLTAVLAPSAWGWTGSEIDATPLSGYTDPRLVRTVGESDLAYVKRATHGLAEAVEHSDADQPREDWQVAAARFITGGRFASHEGVIVPEHLRRGICSQHAAVLAEALRRNGISTADAYQIDGHVVVEFQHDGQTWVTDPDIGVGPYRVDWTDRDELEETARREYAHTPAPYDAAWITPILTDTAGDVGPYPRDYLAAIEDHQREVLEVVYWGRWLLAAIGLVLIAAGIRFRGR